MNLPELPKKHGSQEADFGLVFRKWIEAVLPPTASFEHKTSRGSDRFPFYEVKDLQIGNALKIKGKGNLIRVQSGTPGAPDYIWLKAEPAYVVIEYPKGFVLIDIDDFLNEKRVSVSKSLTYNRAIEISKTHVKF